SNPKYVLAGVPMGASSASTIIPSCAVPRPTSSSPQIIPSETSPRIFDLLILNGSPLIGYTVVPTVATTTRWPAATLGAPQTICNGSPAPTSTVVTFRRSALGCCSHVFTSPTTNPSSPPGMRCTTSSASTSS